MVAGRACLVVGGGRVAAREGPRACSSAGPTCTWSPPRSVDELAGRSTGVTWRASGPTRRARSAGYRLVIAATDDPAVNRAVFRDGEAAGVWVNAADDPAQLLVHPAGPASARGRCS